MKKNYLSVIRVALVVLLLVVGIPVLINEVYKMDTIYVTQWNASDVLVFYGVILSVIGAVYVLTRTIGFSVKQIQAERFIERERAKWNKVEDVIMEVLADIMPFNMLYIGEAWDESTFIYLSKVLMHLQKYSLRIKTSLNIIKCYISPLDYPQIEFLVNEVQKVILSLCDIEVELEDIYSHQRNELSKYNGIIPPEVMKVYVDKISKTTEKILPVHDGPYQQLYNIKRDIFTKIYVDIDAQANQILKFGRKGGKTNAHT